MLLAALLAVSRYVMGRVVPFVTNHKGMARGRQVGRRTGRCVAAK